MRCTRATGEIDSLSLSASAIASSSVICFPASILAENGEWLGRARGIRANASHRSHAELSEAPDLDMGDPVELGKQYARLKRRLPHLTVVGGCCGTDHRHLEQIAQACLPLFV